MKTNYMKLQFLSLPENEPFVRGAVAAFTLPMEPNLSDLSDIKTAVSEAITNAIVHAYRGARGMITVECESDGDELHITVCDQGAGIPDLTEAMQPFFTTLPSEEHSGMGFTIMQTFMTAFAAESTEHEGTVIHMTKKLNRNAE